MINDVNEEYSNVIQQIVTDRIVEFLRTFYPIGHGADLAAIAVLAEKFTTENYTTKDGERYVALWNSFNSRAGVSRETATFNKNKLETMIPGICQSVYLYGIDILSSSNTKHFE